MPRAAKKPCTTPGCGSLTDGGPCTAHKRERQRASDQRRGTSAQRGYGARWQRARRRFLAKHPLCRVCQDEGLTKAADVVDHIVPHQGDERLFWDESNWQPLCFAHHAAKTASEDGGFGNAVGQTTRGG